MLLLPAGVGGAELQVRPLPSPRRTLRRRGTRRQVDAEDEALLRQFAARYFPDGAGATMALRACLFTNTPDEHFIIDRHPDFPQVVLASPCSGHGYKFCSVVGGVLADLACGDGTTSHGIDLVRLGRLHAVRD